MLVQTDRAPDGDHTVADEMDVTSVKGLHRIEVLANAGHDTRSLQDYLGHKNIQHTVRYTELAPTRYKDFWR